MSLQNLIVADSGCDLRHMDILDDVPFVSVPLTIHVGKREYIDDDDLNARLLLAAIHAQKAAATTACPPPGAFAEAFEKADRVICFTISSALSGTYNSAVIARDMVLEDHPEKKIAVIDTRSAGGVMLLMMRKAAALMKRDLPFELMVRMLQEYRRQRHIIFTLSSYDNLVKTGRMSALKGLLAGKLGIRAIAQGTAEGTIDIAKTARGEDAAFSTMLRLMAEQGATKDTSVVIGHCQHEVGAAKLAAQITARFGTQDVTLLPTQGLTGFYAMDKGILLSF